MFKPHYAKCKKCEIVALIVVKKGYCRTCNEKSKKEKKTGKPILSLNDLKALLAPKKKFRKPTGELDVFKDIWAERSHTCQVTGALIRRFDIRCFSHILTKGAYPAFRLEKENIWLVTPEVHTIWENGNRNQPMFQKKIEKAQELKQRYYAK